jgi:hypothetical protein
MGVGIVPKPASLRSLRICTKSVTVKARGGGHCNPADEASLNGADLRIISRYVGCSRQCCALVAR